MNPPLPSVHTHLIPLRSILIIHLRQGLASGFILPVSLPKLSVQQILLFERQFVSCNAIKVIRMCAPRPAYLILNLITTISAYEQNCEVPN
jgi:hypothetical protein